MKTWIRSLYVAIFCVVTLFGVTERSLGAEYGDYACVEEVMLRDTIVNWLTIDDESGEIVNPGCTVLPADYEPDVVRVVGPAIGDCIINFCTVEIQEAAHDGRLYYIAYGWIEQHDLDALEDAQLAESPLVPIGVPCDLFDCQLQDAIATANQ